jgi:hypothetical protein
MMTRRSVLASLGAVLALPAAVRAQTPAGMRRIVWFGLGKIPPSILLRADRVIE